MPRHAFSWDVPWNAAVPRTHPGHTARPNVPHTAYIGLIFSSLLPSMQLLRRSLTDYAQVDVLGVRYRTVEFDDFAPPRIGGVRDHI